MKRSTELRQLLASKDILVMPDAYDPLTARIIESLGYKAVQCSGYSFSISAAYPTEDAMTLEENVSRTAAIADSVEVPVMADGEDGFGGPDSVRRMVTEYVRAGVAGSNIEDQILREKSEKMVISGDAMVDKITAAREAAKAAGDPDFIINARTDVLKPRAPFDDPMAEAIMRGNLYLNAGADLIFIVNVATIDQVKALVAGVDGPISIASGMPYTLNGLTVNGLRECGVARTSFPSLAVYATIKAVTTVMQSVRDREDFAEIEQNDWLCGYQDAAKLVAVR